MVASIKNIKIGNKYKSYCQIIVELQNLEGTIQDNIDNAFTNAFRFMNEEIKPEQIIRDLELSSYKNTIFTFGFSAIF